MSRISAALLLLAASTVLVAAEAPKFDGRGWTVGHHQKNARQEEAQSAEREETG